LTISLQNCSKEKQQGTCKRNQKYTSENLDKVSCSLMDAQMGSLASSAST